MSRVLFLGLDGVGRDLATHLAARGVMPHLGRLLALAPAWETVSPLPEVSPVCWTSLFSGQGPAAHGIFGFAHPVPGSWAIQPVDSTLVAAPRLWNLASAAGLRSVVLNVPLTYPAEPLHGSLVAGFVTPDLARGVYPPELLPRLLALGYRPEADLDTGRDDPGALAADLECALEVRLTLFEQMLSENWNLYVAVVTDTDRVNHFLWPALWDDAHPLAGPARRVYALVDEFLGRVWQKVAPQVESGEITFLIAADHAFGPIRSEVYLNRWLAQEGYLLYEGQPPHERILPATRALALDPGRIYLNYAGRFPGGWLTPGREAGRLLESLAAGLSALRFSRVEIGPDGPRLTEEAPIARVHLGRDLYPGAASAAAPDLVAEAAPGYSLRGGLDKAGVFGLSHLTGTHRPRGGLAWGLPAPGERPARVEGLGRLAARALGLDLPGEAKKITL
ncbi:MAG: alkaline phosphatase family protein [Deltaproteobacteria bacterium]|nr:alkaline phosphatase family protein [Deltaproteobacteria bacterium]